MKVKKHSNQTVGNIGLFYVCYRLSQLGWNVMPTSRNARGIDIIAYNEEASATRTFQVKALSKRNPVGLGTNLSHLVAEFFVVCRHVRRDSPECFVLTQNEVKELTNEKIKDGKRSYWLQPRDYETAGFHEAWNRIGQAASFPRPAVETVMADVPEHREFSRRKAAEMRRRMTESLESNDPLTGFNADAMQFTTYENQWNPHVTIHESTCSQICKRGGEDKAGQGEYRQHESLELAKVHAAATGLPVRICSFCKPDHR